MDGDAIRSPTDHVHPLEAGDPPVVGGYPLIGRIGAGGMGTVYLAREPGSDGRVAVKTIHPHLAADAAFRQRFRDEADLAGRVASFCTARVVAHGEEAGRPYIVSEYVGGMSLQHRISSGGPLPGADVHGVAVSVISALAAIHSAGLVHRDLKPANVMLTLSGCRVIDFGIARALDATATLAVSGTVLGTPGWMAPEVLRGGTATPAADIFAWGCLIAYAATGRLPFGDGEANAVAVRVMREEPDLSGLPASLLPAVRSALSKAPLRRPSASDLLLALVEQTEIPCGTSARKNGFARKNGTPSILVPKPRPPLGAGSGDGGPDTAAFTVITHVGARSSTRARLLAAVGAAAATVLAGGLFIGLSGKDGGASPVRRATAPPSSPAVGPSAVGPSRSPVRRVIPGEPGPSKTIPARKQDDKGKGKGKDKGRG